MDCALTEGNPLGACRKRRAAKLEKPSKRVRPEVVNDQTRKLRSALPSEEPSMPSMQDTNGFDGSTMQASNSAAVEEEPLDNEDYEVEEEMDSQSRREHACFCICMTSLTRLSA